MNLDQETANQVWQIIRSGGPVMVALGILAFMLYKNTFSLYLFVSRLNVKRALEELTEPLSRGLIADYRETLHSLVNSQLKYARVLIVAAPLLGLLGTVIGMLDTFKGIAAESSHDTTQEVADGVKVALVTTQTGLMIAIFGLFLTRWISRLYRRKDSDLVDIKMDLIRKESLP